MARARLVWALLCPLLATVPPSAQAAHRVLHVALYPYIPQPEAAALTLKQGFERTHPDVTVDVTFNPNYYSTRPEDAGLLYEHTDIHEIDTIFLGDFVARHKLAKLPQAFLATLDAPEPLARLGVSATGDEAAVPHWMCMDFLIYRADKTNLAAVSTLAQLETDLTPTHGLLLGMSQSTLGELYFTTWIAHQPLTAQPNTPGPPPDPALVDRLRRMLALEPPGLGRAPIYDQREGFYARQFARGRGAAFVGYSEMMHEAMDETLSSCRIEDHCVTPDQLRVTAFPFADDTQRSAVWLDAFGIDAHVHGQAFADAEAFIRYAVSLPAYRALLVPAPGDPPRYLLPATTAAFTDPPILRAAPLYPTLHAITDHGTVVTGTGAEQAMTSLAAAVDGLLARK